MADESVCPTLLPKAVQTCRAGASAGGGGGRGIAGREKNSPAGAGDAWGLFLGVGDEFEDTIRVVNDFEVEPPVLVDPGLPAVIGFIILLGPQGGMLEILN